ncbi:MAG: lytic transglycosylase domain-containing protein [Alphaproteobacteria bacterium]|nr:lytic transglycosylase domain-containing protein [Alphaproteobacteria bacterium]
MDTISLLKRSCHLTAILCGVTLAALPVARDSATGTRASFTVAISETATDESAATAEAEVPDEAVPEAEAQAEPPAADLSRAQIAEIVEQTAPDYNVDPKLVMAVIATESSFNPKAVSAANAQGLMQLRPDTAQRFGVNDAFDPADNIRGGTKYLRWLIDNFRGDLSLVLAAYNVGENAVRHWGGIPPQSRSYLKKVRLLYRAKHHPTFSSLSLWSEAPAPTPSN